MDNIDISDKIEYVIAAISEFGRKHGLSNKEAYHYLKRFKGMEMLDKFYDVMHTLSFKEERWHDPLSWLNGRYIC